MPEEIMVKMVGFPHRVNFMTTHPLTQELLYSGDVVIIPEELITPAQKRDSLFSRMPEGTSLNRVPRDREQIVGITISEDAYNAQIALAALNSKVAPGFSQEAKVSGNTVPRR